MSLLEEIRQQPKHVREIMFGLCVVITVSIAGLTWYRSLEKNLFALLNPEEMAQQNQYAQTGSGLFSDIGSAFSGLGGSIANFIGINDDAEVKNNRDTITDSEKPYLLPLTEPKE